MPGLHTDAAAAAAAPAEEAFTRAAREGFSSRAPRFVWLSVALGSMSAIEVSEGGLVRQVLYKVGDGFLCFLWELGDVP